MLVLTLEASTTSAKALLYDSVVGLVSVKTIPYDRQLNDVATQDCESVCLAVLEAGRSVAFGKDVRAVALCGTWHSIVVCDKSMRPVTRTYSWAYTGSSGETAKMRTDRALTLNLYHRTGCMAHSTYGLYTLMHLKDAGLDLSDKLFVSQAGYIFYRLTGLRVESASTMSGSGLLDIYSKRYDQAILDMLGLNAEQFGRLASYREPSPLSVAAASALGIQPGLPVVPAHPDGAMNQVGAGALGEGIMTLSVGTSAAMRLTVNKPVIPEEPSLWCYVGADSWVSGAATAGACNCVDWFRSGLLSSSMSFSELEDKIANIEESPVFLPFIFGERCPGWRDGRLGGFFDLVPSSSYPALYRGLLEGVCFNLRQCYEILSSTAGEPEEIRLSGGIVNSPLWTQMLSDVLDRKIFVSNFDQASSLGAAALALFACGELKELSDFKTGHCIAVEPGRDRERYAKKYERYLYWYDKTK
jgi:gluconokinase